MRNRESNRKWPAASVVSALVLCLAAWVQAQPPAARPAAPPRPRINLREGPKVLRDLTFARAGDKPLLLDLYLPEKSEGSLPLVVWIHGGGWSGGDKQPCPAAWMAGRAYAVASVNYRLSGEATWPAQIEDCKAAIRWLRANAKKYNYDSDRIGAWGSSAGGHLAALLGTSGDVRELEGALGNPEQSSHVQAVCDFFGPADLLQLVAQEGPVHPGARNPVERLIGGPLEENKDKLKQASPISYVTADDAPCLIVHGDKDELVPLRQSELLHEALKKAGVETHLHVVKGAGHGFPPNPEVLSMVAEFFDRHLKNGDAKPQKE